MSFISGEYKSKYEGNMGKNVILGNREHFDFGEQGKMPNYFLGNKGTGTPPPPQNIMLLGNKGKC